MAVPFFSTFGAQGNAPDQAGTEQNNSTPENRPGDPRFAPVPENNLGTKDPVLLQMAEDVAGGMRAHELRIGDAYLPGKLDAQHLRHIHAYVMQDIYEKPGATRGDERLLAEASLKDKPEAKLPLEYDSREGAHGQVITLVPASKVNERLDELSERLARENYLGGLEKPEFVARLADYHLEYSKIAPFRAGNEHVINVVLNQVGEEAGYVVAPNAAKNLREVTDATLDSGSPNDKARLIQVLSSVTKEDEGQLAEIRRRPTQWAIPVLPSAEQEKRWREEDMGQAGTKLVGRVGGVEGEQFRASMRAIIAGDPAPNDINVARTTATKYAGEDFRNEAERIVKGAAYLDNYRRNEQQQGRQADMAGVQPRTQEHTTKAEITR